MRANETGPFCRLLLSVILSTFYINAAFAGETILYTGDGVGIQIDPTTRGGYPPPYSNAIFPTLNTSLSGNKVTIDYNFDTDEPLKDVLNIYGGVSTGSGAVNDNTVLIRINTPVTHDYEIVGGYSEYGDVSRNVVTVSPDSITRGLFSGNGGYSVYGNVEENIVNANAPGSYFGGVSEYGNAVRNTVNIGIGVDNGYAVGGSTYSGAAIGNIVNLNGGNVDEASGGYGYAANENIVNLNGGTVGSLYGGRSTNDATYNVVNLNGGSVGRPGMVAHISGGAPDNSGGGAAKAIGNIVNLNGIISLLNDVTLQGVIAFIRQHALIYSPAIP